MRLHRRHALPAVLALLLVTLIPIGAGVADAATSRWAANCTVNIRSRPTTLSARRGRILPNTPVAVSRTVSGGSYATTCRGAASGRSWLAITAIGGRSVKSLFGVSTIYAAAGLFRRSSDGYLYGVDVSQWNGRINFSKVKASGRSFVIARATAGRIITDSAYARNRAGALKAHIAFTAYHFAHPDGTWHDAIKEADHFLAVAHLRKGMLVPALDLESGSRLGPTRLTAWVKAWLGRVYSRTGVKPMIYTTYSFWHDYLANSRWFAEHGYTVLWIARWHSSRPVIPAASWDGHYWTMWQYSDCGSVPGIASRCVDVDKYRGTSLRKITW